MTKRRKRSPTPIALLWTKRDQVRFIDAVERLSSLVYDLTNVVIQLKEETAKRPRRRTRQPVIENGAPADA
jgi:hypothetical protein